jgi:peptidoglycan hydrolase CwlO-like protein
MSKCPYPELMVDECSGIVLENPMFNIWHQGYEARKLETMKGDITKQKELDSKMKQVDKFGAEFIARTNELNKLHTELKQREEALAITHHELLQQQRELKLRKE